MTDSAEVEEALNKLKELIPPDMLIKLPILIIEVFDCTGFGDVRLVIAERRVTRIKQEKSY